MPELPEVEAARGLLRTHCLSARIVSVEVDDDEVCTNVVVGKRIGYSLSHE
jgi:formamidopyrimidine-DNA glycosylase